MVVMNKGNTNKKSNIKILITFIIILAVCFVGGFVSGKVAAQAEGTVTLENITNAIKDFSDSAIPIAFMIVSILGIVIPLAAFIRCNAMYKKLQSDKENDDLWDSLEDNLNQPMILSNLFFMIDLCLFFCFLLIGNASKYQSAVSIVSVILFVIASVMEILIPKLILDIEKKLNPEKQGNILDVEFQKVWMNSCDEAERLTVYKAGYKAYQNTNVACLILIVAAFICSMTFKTDMIALVFICIIWFVNNMSYMLRAAKLEKRNNT
jgi:hypothetical protein